MRAPPNRLRFALVQSPKLRERRRHEAAVPLHAKAEGPDPHGLQLREREVADLDAVADDQAEEQVLPVKSSPSNSVAYHVQRPAGKKNLATATGSAVCSVL